MVKKRIFSILIAQVLRSNFSKPNFARTEAVENRYNRVMRDFKRSSSSGRGRSFGSSRGGFKDRGHSSRPTTLYPAVCSKCGKDCQVPFRPSGEKPVLCRDCFREQGGDPRSHETRRPEERSFAKPAFQPSAPVQQNDYKGQLDALTQKVDKILAILESAMTVSEEPEEVIEVIEQPMEKKKRTSKKAL